MLILLVHVRQLMLWMLSLSSYITRYVLRIWPAFHFDSILGINRKKFNTESRSTSSKSKNTNIQVFYSISSLTPSPGPLPLSPRTRTYRYFIQCFRNVASWLDQYATKIFSHKITDTCVNKGVFFWYLLFLVGCPLLLVGFKILFLCSVFLKG